MRKTLLIFNFLHGPNTKDLSPESNSWYLKNYESYFNQVNHLSLLGGRKKPLANGASKYHFAGSGHKFFDMFLAPVRLYLAVRKIRPTHLITYEQIWLWWAVLLVKLFTRIPVYLLPLTFPEQMYTVTGKGMSGRLPLWLERFLLRCSYRSCYKVITSYNLGNYINWMMENKIIGKKLIVSDTLPESVVFPEFMKRLNDLRISGDIKRPQGNLIRLIYVGRLHKEKMTDHLIKVMPLIKEKVPDIFLLIVGQGPDKENLSELAGELGLGGMVKFQDYVAHSRLPDLLLSSDIFVSPSTGHAFREAAICGLPIVAYNIDWIKGFLTPNENFYGVDEINYRKLADGIIDVSLNTELRKRLSGNITSFAERYWASDHLQQSLITVFEQKTNRE